MSCDQDEIQHESRLLAWTSWVDRPVPAEGVQLFGRAVRTANQNLFQGLLDHPSYTILPAKPAIEQMLNASLPSGSGLLAGFELECASSLEIGQIAHSRAVVISSVQKLRGALVSVGGETWQGGNVRRVRSLLYLFRVLCST
jgi:hypothetical protein